ncbi:MAG: arginase [Alphaproteobacteria bacterium]
MGDTSNQPICLIGVPVEDGAKTAGCAMGPAALRVAGLGQSLADLGRAVHDLGDLSVGAKAPAWERVAKWSALLDTAAFDALKRGEIPVFLGGDHSLSMGSVAGVARFAANIHRPLFVLWLDAHADFNAPQTSPSGNLHGMSLAYLCGAPGFGGLEPAHQNLVDPKNVFVFGARSLDAGERQNLRRAGVNTIDMRKIDEVGVSALMRQMLEAVAAAGGMLHVSLDIDFLDPEIAPGVATTVPGGATFREAHLIMEMLADARVVTSLDLVELNPFLDQRGKSARLMAALAASLFGQQIFAATRPDLAADPPADQTHWENFVTKEHAQ